MRSDSEQFTFWFLDLSFIVQSLSHRVLIPPSPTASFFPRLHFSVLQGDQGVWCFFWAHKWWENRSPMEGMGEGCSPFSPEDWDSGQNRQGGGWVRLFLPRCLRLSGRRNYHGDGSGFSCRNISMYLTESRYEYITNSAHTDPINHLLITFQLICNGLSVYVPWKFICWNTDLSYDGIRRWALWAVNGTRSGAPMNGIRVLL